MVMCRCLLLTACVGLARAAMDLAPSGSPALAPSTAPTGPIKQPPLPYNYSALEPIIDEKTMMIHYSKHQKAYVDNLNTALATSVGAPFNGLSLEAMLKAVNTSALPKTNNFATLVRNNAGGNANHIYYWSSMTTPNATQPNGQLADKITSTFGSLSAFKKNVTAKAVGQFGSGFAWLVWTPSGELKITSTANQDNPLMSALVPAGEAGIPVLCIDVWEHAYYLKYQNQRPLYVKNWFNVINWDQAETNYQNAVKGQSLLVSAA